MTLSRTFVAVMALAQTAFSAAVPNSNNEASLAARNDFEGVVWWDVQFYDRQNGAADGPANGVEYRDSIDNEGCTQVGAPGAGSMSCAYMPAGGAGMLGPTQPCTEPFQNPAQFVLVGDHTSCSIYADSGCTNLIVQLNSGYGSNFDNPTTEMYFQCQNQ